MPVESEIKLRLAPTQLFKVRGHTLVTEYARQDSLHQHLQSTYFDTPDLQLLQQTMGLRVRRLGEQWIQTLKGSSSGEAGLQRRQEWEGEVESWFPALEQLPAEARVGTLGESDLETRLIPIFETDFWRTSWNLQVANESTIELALDQGCIRSGEYTEPLSEVELELKQGREKDLYRAALQLAEALPIAIEHTSKAERGYRLYRQQLSPLMAPPRPPANRETDLRVLGYWLACLEYGERLLLEREDPQGMNYLRMATIKWQEYLSAIGQEGETALQADLGWLGNGLQKSNHFAGCCKVVADPRYSQLLLRLGAYLAE